MDRRYTQNKGASVRPAARAEAFARANLARSRVRARSMRGDERYTSADSGSNGASMGALIASARAADQAGLNQAFEQEGSGAYGAGPSFEDARREARFGRGKLDLYA